jgi:hypothetical protein
VLQVPYLACARRRCGKVPYLDQKVPPAALLTRAGVFGVIVLLPACPPGSDTLASQLLTHAPYARAPGTLHTAHCTLHTAHIYPKSRRTRALESKTSQSHTGTWTCMHATCPSLMFVQSCQWPSERDNEREREREREKKRERERASTHANKSSSSSSSSGINNSSSRRATFWANNTTDWAGLTGFMLAGPFQFTVSSSASRTLRLVVASQPVSDPRHRG